MAIPRPAVQRKSLPPNVVPDAEEAPPPQKKKSRVWLVVGIVTTLAVLAGGGGAAWYFLSPATPETPAGAEQAAAPAAEAKVDAGKKPVFVTLDSFTVNLQPESGDHYLQAGIVVQVADSKMSESMKLYMPVIRNRFLMLLSSKVPSELMSLDGKKKLIAELMTATRESIPGMPAEGGIENAFLSSFVIQ